MPPVEFQYGATTGYYKDMGLTSPGKLGAVAYQWSTGYIDNGAVDNHPISLALEFRGNLNIPHFAYRIATTTGSRLLHTYWAPPNWIRETVLTSTQGQGVGYAASIAIDSLGRPHISFVRSQANHTFDVMYVRKQGGAWNLDTVRSGLTVFPSRTSIALDPSGIPHIAYPSAARAGTIQHAVLVGGLWKREIVAAGVGAADFAAIDVDRFGGPHISYYSQSDQAIQSARLQGLNWNVDTIAGSVGSVNQQSDTSIKFDVNGTPHVCYSNFGAGTLGLGHAQLLGNTWTHEIVTTSASAHFADIAVDRNLVPRISYFDQQGLHYAERQGGTWSSVAVDGSNGSYTSLAIDLSGRPYIAYYDRVQADAMLAIGQ